MLFENDSFSSTSCITEVVIGKKISMNWLLLNKNLLVKFIYIEFILLKIRVLEKY